MRTRSKSATRDDELFTWFQHTGTARPVPYPYLCDTAAGPDGGIYLAGYVQCKTDARHEDDARPGPRRLDPPLDSVDWSQQFGGKSHVIGLGIDTDGRGGFYVAGWSAGGPVDFGGVAWEHAGGHLFLARFDGDGRAAWACPVAPLAVRPALLPFLRARVAALPGGDACVAAGLNLDAPHRFVLARHAHDGARRWRHQHIAASALDVATDAAGRAYVTGTAGKPPDWPGARLAPRSEGTAYVACFDAEGICAWTAQADAEGGHSNGLALAVHADDGVRVTGRFSGTLRLEPGCFAATSPAPHESLFVARFAPDGAPDWLHSTSPFDAAPQPRAGAALGRVAGTNIAVDAAGTTYVVEARSLLRARPRLRRSTYGVTAYAANGVEKWSIDTRVPVQPDATCRLTVMPQGHVCATTLHASYAGVRAGRFCHYPLTQSEPARLRFLHMSRG